jgi:hypothetical protein
MTGWGNDIVILSDYKESKNLFMPVEFQLTSRNTMRFFFAPLIRMTGWGCGSVSVQNVGISNDSDKVERAGIN